MAHSFFHSKSSAHKFGGIWEDYVEIHNFLDSSKSSYANLKHRAILHNTFGIFIAERIFGIVLKRKSDGKEVPVRTICEQHIIEDCGFIPTVENWLDDLGLKDWMLTNAKPLSKDKLLAD